MLNSGWQGRYTRVQQRKVTGLRSCTVGGILVEIGASEPQDYLLPGEPLWLHRPQPDNRRQGTPHPGSGSNDVAGEAEEWSRSVICWEMT